MKPEESLGLCQTSRAGPDMALVFEWTSMSFDQGSSERSCSRECARRSLFRDRYLWSYTLFSGLFVLGLTFGLSRWANVFSQAEPQSESRTRNGVPPRKPENISKHPAATAEVSRQSLKEPQATSPGPVLETPCSAVLAMDDAMLRSKIVGRWRGSFYGTQTITNYPDGSAELHSRLDFLSALLYGSELKMKLTWRVEKGILTHEIQSGVPAENVERLIRQQGARRSYRILELDEDSMRLQDIESPEIFRIWQRVHDL